MSWSYRVIRTLLPPERATNDERVCHQIAEVYFDDDGKPTGYGEAGDVFDCGDGTGDAIKELAWTVERYQKALALPVIDFGEQSSSVRLPYDEWKALTAAAAERDRLAAQLAEARRACSDQLDAAIERIKQYTGDRGISVLSALVREWFGDATPAAPAPDPAADVFGVSPEGLETMVPYGRLEDMSPDGCLRVLFDQDGDAHLWIVPSREGFSQGVEFCTGIGGGRSPRTRAALLQLAQAIRLDNEEQPQRDPDRERQEPAPGGEEGERG